MISGRVVVGGPLFEKDVSATLQRNAEDAVARLTGTGGGLVAGNVRPFSRQTAEGVESVVLPPSGPHSVFGIVRMRPGLSRSPGSPTNPKYSAARRPYIIAAVLETGNYARHPRTPHWAFRRAFQNLQVQAHRINHDFSKGLG